MGCDENEANHEGELVNDDAGVEYTLFDTESGMGSSTLETLADEDTVAEQSEKDDDSRTLTIQPIGDSVATFEVTTSERIEALSSAHDVTVSGGRSAEDAIVESVRHYRVRGDVTYIRVSGPAEAFLDGQRLNH